MGNQKREVIDLIERLPDDIDVSTIIEELYFKWQVDEGLRDVVEGQTLSHEELKKRMAQWRTSAGR